MNSRAAATFAGSSVFAGALASGCGPLATEFVPCEAGVPDGAAWAAVTEAITAKQQTTEAVNDGMANRMMESLMARTSRMDLALPTVSWRDGKHFDSRRNITAMRSCERARRF